MTMDERVSERKSERVRESPRKSERVREKVRESPRKSERVREVRERK